MLNTAEMVADSRAIEDGVSGTVDDLTLFRWVKCFQNSVNLLWNDRLWNFKLVTLLGFAFDPLVDNMLPTEFGSFEGLGAGVYGTEPIRPLSPVYASELNAASLGQTVQDGMPLWFAVDYVLGAPRLRIWPKRAETLNLIFLRKKPKLTIPEMLGDPDELYFIPEQWHHVVQSGGEWQNKMKSGSAAAEPYQALWKANLEEMRARERNGGTSLNTLAVWEPSRMVGGGGM